MQASRIFRLTAIGFTLLGAGSVLADELQSPADPVQQRERVRSMSPEDRNAQREQMRDQMQERVRNMTPEEQRLMRETGADGRSRMENRQAAQGEGRRRGGGEGGYGQGYETRRGESGGGGGGGGGRGMGGGRHS